MYAREVGFSLGGGEKREETDDELTFRLPVNAGAAVISGGRRRRRRMRRRKKGDQASSRALGPP
jgi:hypothetical protein